MSEYLWMPGGVDVHTHLREPSTNKAETIYSGTRAALLGGFVLVADMPNNPGLPVWSAERLQTKIEIGQSEAWVPTAFYAGSQPEADNVGELEKMAEAAIGLKLYGDLTTGNDQSYEADDFKDIIGEWHRVARDKPVMFHAGEDNLEDMIELAAADYGLKLHICHVNSPEQINLVSEAKKESLRVTCGVCPHHLLKTSHDVLTQGTFAEMKPPLADQYDAEQLMGLLGKGHIDSIETDFAPHSIEAKFEAENSGGHCYGVPGIENVIPLLLYQVHKGRLSHERFIDAIHTQPAELLGVNFDSSTRVKWSVEGGSYRIGEADIQASCGWTPYLGMLAIGKIDEVRIAGQALVLKGSPLSKYPQVVTDRGHKIERGE